MGLVFMWIPSAVAATLLNLFIVVVLYLDLHDLYPFVYGAISHHLNVSVCDEYLEYFPSGILRICSANWKCLQLRYLCLFWMCCDARLFGTGSVLIHEHHGFTAYNQEVHDIRKDQ